MNKKSLLIIMFILMLGIIYRILLTSNGNFIFNMDNARDFVDVREMAELKKLRLTGPTSAIQGVFNGPLWYYLLLIPYLVTHGDPYGAIVMGMILWAIGGFYLLKLVNRYGNFITIIGLIWVTSNYIVLANLYSFNPNPVILLTPLMIYGLVKYLEKGGKWIMVVWLLSGAFFNFEMNFGIFMPVIIFISIFLINRKFLKDKLFWVGVSLFIATLLPQLLFDLKHQFIMSKSIFKFLSEGRGNEITDEVKKVSRIKSILGVFFDTFLATLSNYKFLTLSLLVLPFLAVKRFFSEGRKDNLVIVSLLFILIPFLVYLLLPVTVNQWHLGAEMAASIILIGFTLFTFWKINLLGKIISITLAIMLLFYSLFNIYNFFFVYSKKPNLDPSLYKNEIAAIDYVYKWANGRNFKVYTYLPSVYDFPYQYLFWWYGKRKYGYLPIEYAYAPNQPAYIPNQDKFQGDKNNPSQLVFLIREPDIAGYRRDAWTNSFKDLKFITSEHIGLIEIEVREQAKKSE